MTESSQDEIVKSKSGPFEFLLHKSDGFLGQLTAISWRYYLERNIPLTRGLDQRIRLCRIEFPRRLPPVPIVELLPEFLSLAFPPYSAEVYYAILYLFPFPLVSIYVF